MSRAAVHMSVDDMLARTAGATWLGEANPGSRSGLDWDDQDAWGSVLRSMSVAERKQVRKQLREAQSDLKALLKARESELEARAKLIGSQGTHPSVVTRLQIYGENVGYLGRHIAWQISTLVDYIVETTADRFTATKRQRVKRLVADDLCVAWGHQAIQIDEHWCTCEPSQIRELIGSWHGLVASIKVTT